MYIESVPNRGSPPAILLRESFRADGRVRKRTLANLSAWPSALVEGFRTLLRGGVAVAADRIRIRRALPHGHAVACWARCGRLASTGCLVSRPTGAWRRWRWRRPPDRARLQARHCARAGRGHRRLEPGPAIAAGRGRRGRALSRARLARRAPERDRDRARAPPPQRGGAGALRRLLVLA